MHALVFGWSTPFGDFAFGIGNTHADYIYNPHPFHTSQKFYTLQKNNIMPDPIKRGRKRKARKIRKGKGVRKNDDGTVSTHLMATYTGEGGKNYVAPTIAPNKDGVYKPQSFSQALKKGEVFEFKNKKRADKFAKGSWKNKNYK